MIYVGTYALIYLHTILGDSNGEGIVSRDGLPRGVLPIGISKMQNIVQALKFYAQLKIKALYLTPYTCYLSRDYSNSYRIEQNHYSNIFENIYNFDQSDLSSEWGLLIDDMEQLNFNFISITTLNMN